MIRDAPPKHPDSSKWYWLQWDDTELDNASITGLTVTLPDGIDADEQSITGRMTGVRLSGGTQGQYYKVRVQITTSGGETLHETLLLRVDEVGH